MSTIRRPKARRPGAFALDDPKVIAVDDEILPEEFVTELDPQEAGAHQAVETIAHPTRRGVRWGKVAALTGSALVSFGIALALDSLVRNLFARADWLGWVGLGMAGMFLLAVVALVVRELAGLFRLKRVARLRLACDDAAVRNDRDSAIAAIRSIIGLYSDRPETAKGRRQVAAHLAEIIDGRDLLALAERDLIAPLDAHARLLASAAARRVSVVTAVSPRAFFDVAFVLWECVRLIRRIAGIYGGRPGTLGLFRLLRAVVSHLAVTGSIAVGDTLMQQFVGHGLAGRLSTKLGEGVVNGLMTARIGLSAMDVCRPLPFLKEERPRLKDLAGELVSFRGGDTPPADR